MFVWTPSLDALCPPARGQGTPVTSKPLDDKKFLAAAKALVSNVPPSPSLTDFLDTGRGAPADEAEAFVRAVTAKGDKLVDGIVDRWFARHGARGTIEIMAQIGATRPSAAVLMGQTRALLVARIRQHLAHAPDYQSALDYAASHDGLPPGLERWTAASGLYIVGREVIANLFPDHRPFFESAVAQLEAHRFTTAYLLGAISTDEDVAKLHTFGIGYADWDKHALHVARVVGDAALARLVEYTSRSNQVVGVALALTAFVSASAAAALAEYVERKEMLPILKDYFRAHPELAASALEPHVRSKKKKIREAATAVLDASTS